MIDRKIVCREIKESHDWSMTRENVMTLAALLYIKKHMSEDADKSEDTHPCKMTREEAEAWVHGMENADGSEGGFFSMAETDAHRGDCDSVEFWVAMNMMKSDYGVVAKRYGVDRPAFYADMAHAFLDDKDANPGKLCLYHKYI